MFCFSRKTPEQKQKAVVLQKLNKIGGVHAVQQLLEEYKTLTGTNAAASTAPPTAAQALVAQLTATAPPADCGAPSQSNVDFTGCSHSASGTCTPKCVPGFVGNPTATCASNGKWLYGGACDAMSTVAPTAAPDCGEPKQDNVDFSKCTDHTSTGTCNPEVCQLWMQWHMGHCRLESWRM